MQIKNSNVYHIIGMSPGNSYFKDEEIGFLLKTIVDKFGKVAILIADIPAISTYVALGYPENRARRDKAIPRGNALKNRVRKSMFKLGYSEKEIKIIEWESEVEKNQNYKISFEKIQKLYNESKLFKKDADETTLSVLKNSKRNFSDINKSVETAVHYILSELAFLEFSKDFLKTKKIVYVYHKNWSIYENYISGKYDHIVKPGLDFLLLENPYETFNPIWGLEDELENTKKYTDVLERIEKTKTIRVGFTNYIPAFMYDEEYDNFSGIFYEVIVSIAKKHGWKIIWTEEIGYGVIVDGLKNNRFDIFGCTAWPTPERRMAADFSSYLYTSKAYAWVRKDNIRTNDQLKNDSNVRVAVKEGDISDSISKADFSKARMVRVPQLCDTTELLKFIVENKADFTFAEPYLVEHFNETSKIKLIRTSDKPIRIYENPFMIKKDETRLREFLNTEVELMKKSGSIKKLIKKYTGSEKTFEI